MPKLLGSDEALPSRRTDSGNYPGAIADLKLYQVFKLPEAEARAVQDKIYVLEVKAEKAAKEKEMAAKKTARESSPEAVAERKTNSDQDLIKGLDGAKYTGQSWTYDRSIVGDDELVVRGTRLVWRKRIISVAPNVILDGTPVNVWLETGQMQIVGREAKNHNIPSMSAYVGNILTISEDGKSITDVEQTVNGHTWIFYRQ
jgi:hypothetical protein